MIGEQLLNSRKWGALSRRSRPALLLSLFVTLTLLIGCGGSLAGDWRMVRSAPNRETFAINSVKFAGDGVYSASLMIDGRAIAETGAYDFTGFKLTLKPSAGGSRTFNAVRRIGELELRDGERFVLLEKK